MKIRNLFVQIEQYCFVTYPLDKLFLLNRQIVGPDKTSDMRLLFLLQRNF
jgi:hypothetical protein